MEEIRITWRGPGVCTALIRPAAMHAYGLFALITAARGINMESDMHISFRYYTGGNCFEKVFWPHMNGVRVRS